MKLLSEKSYRRLIALESENTGLKEKLRLRFFRIRELEQSYQTLVLNVGMKGFAVEIKPEVPAKPATLVLRANRE